MLHLLTGHAVCFVRNHMAEFEVSRVVLWWLFLSRCVFWLLIHLPDNCCCFCYCFRLWHHYHIPNSNPHPHNATLSHFSVLQQPHRGFDTIDSANFIVILQHEHLLVPHSGVVWCPSIHLAALFIVRKYHKAVVHNLRGLMRNRKLCRQIIWMSAVVNKQ